MTLPSTGTYTILIRDVNLNRTGGYNLNLTAGNYLNVQVNGFGAMLWQQSVTTRVSSPSI